jgi:tetratricopeptide (TPR) repeat protein
VIRFNKKIETDNELVSGKRSSYAKVSLSYPVFQKISSIIIITIFIIGLLSISSVGVCRDFGKEEKKYYDIAKKLISKKDYVGAETILSIALKKHHSSVNLLVLRGRVRADFLSNYIEAIKDYSEAFKLAPKELPKEHWRRGLCYYNIGMYKMAVMDYTSSIKMAPDNAKVYIRRAKAYAKMGLIIEAQNDLIKARKVDTRWANEAELLLKRLRTGQDLP